MIQKADLGCGFLLGNLFLSVITLGLWLPIWFLIYGLGTFGNAVAREKYLCQVCGKRN